MKQLVLAGLCIIGLTAAMAAGVDRKAKKQKAAVQKEQCCKKQTNCCGGQCCH
ncbi:hypothetical protein [Chitinophaga agrisoli]|uniref:hypothetical protein n=1 Tax=Chitinophaga agrisoli TaxID=2607653 RepID=UPI00166215EF|nr:hypothetical protein [Chitinophaga agrisoli]